MADAGYPNGFKVAFSLHAGPPAGRPAGRHLDRADARRDRHRRAGRTRSRRRCSSRRARAASSRCRCRAGARSPARRTTRCPRSPTPTTRTRRFGAFNVLGYKNPEMDKLMQDAAVEMDEAKRRGFLEEAERARLEGSPAPADRRGRLGLGDAEGQGDDQGARRRGHAGDEHQAGDEDELHGPRIRREAVSSHRDRHPRRLRHARTAAC